MKESQLQSAVLDWLHLHKFFAKKINTTGIYKEATKSWIPSSNVGCPDIIAIREGQAFGIEVKSKYGKQSDHQKEWQSEFERHGGIYILVKDLLDLEAIFDK